MKKYLSYPLYLLFWILYFLAARSVFLLYHAKLTASLNGADIVNTFLYGFRMDLSFASYICIFPFLLFFIKTVSPRVSVQKTIKVYTYILIIVLSFITVADLELYNAWGFRMDATPLQYFKNPKEMGATVSSAPVFILLLVFALFTVLFLFIYNRFFHFFAKFPVKHFYLLQPLLSLILIAVLFIPIRGGIQKIPMNISDVYFSSTPYANHAAINLPWNVMFSLLNSHNEKNPFDYFTPEKAQALVEELYDTGPVHSPAILSTERPNIIFIILESFTAKWVGHLNAAEGVTPGLDKIAADGLYFTNIYASGDRSEKGQIAVLSGYPNQAITSIIKMPNKTRDLPAINQPLEKIGYSSSFTYGGELEFANIKSFLLNAGFDKLTDKYSFPMSQRTTSWGVHDEYVFPRFASELSHKKHPFFATLFTLSSHEPFDVPLKHFTETDDVSLYKNSVYYTDSLLYDFISKSKSASWWPNTLIVITADHGHPWPGNDPNDRPSKFHIPLVFTGGALKTKGAIDALGSQTDIITTVLNQMNISPNRFQWGKDLLDSAANQFAFYSFNNGFGYVTPEGAVTFDNVSRKVIYMDPGFDTSNLKYGKAYMQYSYENFLAR